MSIIHVTKQFVRWINPALNKFAILILILTTEFFLLHFFEYIYTNNLTPVKCLIKGFYYDLVFVSISSILLIIPFTILFKLSKRACKISFYIINSIIVLSSLLLIDYLKINSIPLDHAFYAYPINEIFYIVNESISINFLFIAKYIFALIISISLTLLIFKLIMSKKTYWLSILFILAGIFTVQNSNPDPKNFTSDSEYNFTLNKLSFFAKSSLKYFSGKSEISAIVYLSVVKEYQSMRPEFEFTSIRYPLEHKVDTSDVLGNFFNLKETPPNIVLIIMESLSSAFCGSDAYLGSFTPFLDSLIKHSLYWENFLSTSERTFNVLPSITGSLPYGEKGFMNLIQYKSAVNHTSIIKWLNQNGYHSSFFYGGWIGFDNMGKFLKYQNVDFILNHFGPEYSMIEKNEKGFSWGYPDHEMYNRSFEVLDSIDTNPRFDIFLTLSLHNPFKPPHKTYYDSLFSVRLSSLSLNPQEKEQTKMYSDVFATALYTDDALKDFFNQYQHQKDFENTIFIITGDHRMGGRSKRNQIDTYHVPFIIYSPMLKKAEKFSSVSSHANVSPSLFSFFSKNYNFKMPKTTHALGMQIDTTKSFRNIHKVPFMRISRDITDYLNNKYFITDDELFELKNHMILNKIENKALFDSLKNELNTFKIINKYTTENNLVMKQH